MSGDIKDKIDTVCSNLCSTLQRKNADYGNSALMPPPLVKGMSALDGILVRLGDKFSRLKNLYGGRQSQVDEPLKDTLLDIAGYCVLASILLNSDLEKNLIQDNANKNEKTNKDDELVMCFHAEKVRDIIERTPPVGLGHLQLYFEKEAVAMRRGDVETDPNFRQIIPYVVISDGSLDEFERFLCYRRGKGVGEERLLEKWSLGFGGHVRAGESLSAGTFRELQEELVYDKFLFNFVAKAKPIHIALDASLVDAVHFGVVLFARAHRPSIKVREAAISESKWLKADELKENYDKFERWSQIVIDQILKEKQIDME